MQSIDLIRDNLTKCTERVLAHVEDMAGRRAGPNKTPTSALSVRARVKQPDSSMLSHIVPKKTSAAMPYTRLPVFSERLLEADRAVPHFGTFVLQGLPNPFPASRATHPELIVVDLDLPGLAEPDPSGWDLRRDTHPGIYTTGFDQRLGPLGS